jgi:hypothetical protein
MAKYQLVESRMIKELGVDLLEASEQATFGDEHAIGICIKDCGYYVEGIEPDAEGYLCEDCGTKTVSSTLVAIGVM